MLAAISFEETTISSNFPFPSRTLSAESLRGEEKRELALNKSPPLSFPILSPAPPFSFVRQSVSQSVSQSVRPSVRPSLPPSLPPSLINVLTDLHQQLGSPSHGLRCRYEAFRPTVVSLVKLFICDSSLDNSKTIHSYFSELVQMNHRQDWWIHLHSRNKCKREWLILCLFILFAAHMQLKQSSFSFFLSAFNPPFLPRPPRVANL